MLKRNRPLVRYFGGKWLLAPWIISHFPAHKVYVEPFGGGASVLIRKKRAYAEVYNDLDGEIVNVFRVCRDNGADLVRALELTPFSREELELSLLDAESPIEQARRSVFRSYAGFGSDSFKLTRAGVRERMGFRAKSNRSGSTPAHDWRAYPKALLVTIERLRGVVIENKDALEVMTDHDDAHTLHYVDPPYVSSTRGSRRSYRYEMSNTDHRRLVAHLEGLKGMVIVSGYDCDLYRELFKGWRRIEKPAFAHGAIPRVECLWFNHRAEEVAPDLFGGDNADTI